MMSNIGSPWCYDTAAFCVRDPLDARRWANVCGDLGTPGQVRPADRGDWGQLPLAIMLCRKSHIGKSFPRCDPLFTIVMRNLFEPRGCRVISMKLLRTICAILLIAGAGAVMFASSNSASAQAAGPNSEQWRNARTVKRLKPDERARFEAECKSAAQSEQNRVHCNARLCGAVPGSRRQAARTHIAVGISREFYCEIFEPRREADGVASSTRVDSST
jgi:hypothetical protein